MKNNNTYRVLGVMSGTSLDGVDLAVCQFSLNNDVWEYQIDESITVPYSRELIKELSQATQASALDLNLLEVKLSAFIGNLCKKIIGSHNVDFIASHGHTIFHQPEKGLTTQIGDGNIIHSITNKPVIYDFRSLDVAKGGQGAPLVPLTDKLLFGNYDYCLNLGGIANISFDNDGIRKAFDIVPCNMILNKIANRHGKEFDEGGRIASSGEVVENLLNKWNNLDYYQLNGVKSLGYEWVERNYFDEISRNTVENVAATATEHITDQIAISCQLDSNNAKLLITGGGAKNDYLIRMLKKKLLNKVDIHIPDQKTIDFKEALAFAFLGVKKVRGEINILSSVTGAISDSSSGVMVGFLG